MTHVTSMGQSLAEQKFLTILWNFNARRSNDWILKEAIIMRIGIGVIIAIILIFYWWAKDHPQTTAPVRQGYLLMEPVSV